MECVATLGLIYLGSIYTFKINVIALMGIKTICTCLEKLASGLERLKWAK